LTIESTPRWSADDLEFGEWLFGRLTDEAHREVTGWAPERVERVVARLEAHRAPEARVVPVVLWLKLFSAFATPGRYVYISRRLLEQCRDDEAAAFVLAHEIAHHDLGHVTTAPDWLPDLLRERGGWILAAFYSAAAKSLYGPERECAADRYALDICRAAGYDVMRCLALFDVLERYALDVGDGDMVFGPDPESDQELSPDAPLLTRARIWLWQRSRGYLPIQDRRAALLAHLERIRSAEPPVASA
jgi:hypothetical protein